MSTKNKIIEKAKKLISGSDTATIAYVREDGYPRASTISVAKTEGANTIYMATSMQSLKARRIQANPKVSLCFRRGGDNITLTGKVDISQENELRRTLWHEEDRVHFPDGATGDSFCILLFETAEAEFWIDGESGSAQEDELW